MTLDEDFQAASSWLSGGTNNEVQSLGNDVKLKLYSLYKISTTKSLRPQDGRPGFWDMMGRAKWDSWKALGDRFLSEGVEGDGSERGSGDEAKRRYVVLARELGWDGKVSGNGKGKERDAVPGALGEDEDEDEEEEEDYTNLSDDEDVSSGAGGGTGGGVGMVNVSKLSSQPLDQTGGETLYDFAEAGSSDKISDWARLTTASSEGGDGGKVLKDALDARDPESGYTALHLAADRGHLEVVRTLLRLGADSGVKDDEGQTAVAYAEANGHKDIVDLLGEGS